MDFSKKTIQELKEICKHQKIKGLSNKSKENLIKMIEHHN